ncbi:hypothetical protein FLONG3_4407 [Fusarium longipes]|uniref:Nephrocystin 3-like N-terminal domain-containing protein n=1 Tax=Fusarium longipes TaxID=694270 RepID=A0A395SYG7_9HYPO|nr:hypothetical protein FLONG3_4407 [Fusarium longipes]
MSFAQSFQPYQPYGSQQSSAPQPAKKSFSSTVDFSDQSYEMPYFIQDDAPAVKASGVTRKPVASQPAMSTPRSITPRYELEDRKSNATQENVAPVISKGPEYGTASYKPDPELFLQSFEFPSIQNFHIEPIPSTPNSSLWIDQDPLFTNWKNSKHGLLWLRGSEGSGKSTLMGHVLHSQLREERSTIHLTYSFSICGTELPRTRLGILRALLHQLIPQSPETFNDIKARFERIQSVLPPKQKVAWSAQELFEDLTKVITKILKTRSVCIYVDGIDRSEGDTAAKLVQDFLKLLEKSQPKLSVKEPSMTHGVNIIFSSTTFPAKEPFPQSYIDVDERNGPSLRRFLEEQLSTTDFNTRQLVLSKSGSSFVSARLIIHHIKLCGPTQSSLVQQPSPTPAPISFLLGDYFHHMSQQGNKSLLSLLTWSCLASRPLTLAELRVALSLEMVPKLESTKDLSQAEPFTRYISDENFQSWIKATSWGLLETVSISGQRVVKVMHDSISSFFTSKGLDILSYSSQTPEAPTSPLQIAHKSLATSLLRYLALLPKEPQWEQRIHTEPPLGLLRYAGANWSHHISAAGLSKPDASKMLKLLQWPSDGVLNAVVKLDQENHSIGELQGTLWAHIFAVYGHATLLSVAIKKAGTESLGLFDSQKRNPLHHAAIHGHLAASKQLLKSGAKADVRAINGQTPLHFSAVQGHQNVLKPLVDSDPSLVSATNDLEQAPLLLAVIRGSSSAIKLLLERGAEVKTLDRSKSSILHHAVGTDKANVLKLLLDSGADMNLQNGQGRTPLHLAIAEDRPAIIKLLLERGCRVDIPDVSGKTALHMVAISGNKSCAQELLKQNVAADAKDIDGTTALVYAVEGLHVGIVKLLLEVKADVNARDRLGFSILMLAVRANHDKITKLLLDADPDLDTLSSEGHTAIFYAVYRGKAVSLLSEKEQFVANLLLKHYKKKHTVWNAEWIACKDKFTAEHGKKKTEGDVKSKSKTEPKIPAVSPLTPLPSKGNTQKPTKLENVPKASTTANSSDSKPSALAVGPQKSAKSEPKTAHKPYVKPEATVTSQTHPAASAYSPFTPGILGSNTTPPLPQQPTGTPNTSAPMTVETHKKHQNTSFTSYQPPQSTAGSGRQTGFNTGAGSTNISPASQPRSAAGQQKPPASHRSSWNMYSALSASSPDSAQSTPTSTQNSYISYLGASQINSGGGSFKPFQPFQPNSSHDSPSTTAVQPKSQPDDRYSLPSQNPYTQGQNVSGKQANQQVTVQSYQPFGSNSQNSSASYQPQMPYQSSFDASIKPVAPLKVGRKPIGGHQPAQPMVGTPGKSSPPNHSQPSQPSAAAKQAQKNSGSPSPVGANLPLQAAPGKQSTAPVASQRPTPAQQAVPTQKPKTQQSAPDNIVKASSRPALGQSPVAQKPIPPAASSQKPSSASKPSAPQQSSAAQKPTLVQRPASDQAASSQKAPSSQKPATQTTQSQKPPQGQQPASASKPTLGHSTPAQRPPLAQQNSSNPKPPPAQKQSAPAPQPGTATKPSPTQKPAPPKVTPSEKRPVQSAPVAAPGKPTSIQKPDSSVPKKPTSPPAHPSGPSSKTRPASGQKSNEIQSSSSTHTQSHDQKQGRIGNAGKVAAVAGAGVLAGAAGGYFLSNHIEEHYSESSSFNNQNFSSDNAYYQPVPPVTYIENNYFEAPKEPSEHSEQYSEQEQSDEQKSDDESEDNDSISLNMEASEADDSDDQALSVDEDDNEEDSDDQALSVDDSDDGEDSDGDENNDEDEVDSLNFDQDELDSPDDTTRFTDDEDAADSDNDDVSDGDTNFHNMQADSDIDSDTNLDQDGSASESDGDVGQEVESDEESDHELQNSHGYHQQQAIDQTESEDEEEQFQQNNYQQRVIDESDNEEDVQHNYYNDQYQQESHFQQQYQQQAPQQDSDDEEQPAYYANNQQYAVDQPDSESEDDVQQNYYHDPYQQQSNYQGQQHHAQQPDFDDDSDNQVGGQADYSEGEDNNYGEQNYGGSGYYDGAGYDSDY